MPIRPPDARRELIGPRPQKGPRAKGKEPGAPLPLGRVRRAPAARGGGAHSGGLGAQALLQKLRSVAASIDAEGRRLSRGESLV